ncbi:hypothetical protein EDC01DRAFT_775064 [Geopyxis carbonaria]|nr:hypothetical protein EDC01DRAFT_775064 [Geopyxis carbonaria]
MSSSSSDTRRSTRTASTLRPATTARASTRRSASVTTITIYGTSQIPATLTLTAQTVTVTPTMAAGASTTSATASPTATAAAAPSLSRGATIGLGVGLGFIPLIILAFVLIYRKMRAKPHHEPAAHEKAMEAGLGMAGQQGFERRPVPATVGVYAPQRPDTAGTEREVGYQAGGSGGVSAVGAVGASAVDGANRHYERPQTAVPSSPSPPPPHNDTTPTISPSPPVSPVSDRGLDNRYPPASPVSDRVYPSVSPLSTPAAAAMAIAAGHTHKHGHSHSRPPSRSDSFPRPPSRPLSRTDSHSYSRPPSRGLPPDDCAACTSTPDPTVYEPARLRPASRAWAAGSTSGDDDSAVVETAREGVVLSGSGSGSGSTFRRPGHASMELPQAGGGMMGGAGVRKDSVQTPGLPGQWETSDRGDTSPGGVRVL